MTPRNAWGIGLLLMGLCVAGVPVMADSLDDAQEKYREVQVKIRKNNAEIQKRKAKQSKVLQDISLLNRDIRSTTQLLRRTEDNLQFTQKRVQITSRDLEETQEEYKEKIVLFENRLRALYKNRSFGALELFFSSRDLSVIMDYTVYFEKVLMGDSRLIQQVRQEFSALRRKREELENKKQEIVQLKKSVVQKRSYLSGVQQQKQSLASSLREEITRFERQNAELERVSNDMATLIRSRGGSRVALGTGRFIMPTKGWISSQFGYRKHPIARIVRMHTGVDFAAPRGYQIVAADSGVVIFAGPWGGYGNATIIDHGRLTTVYAHQSRIVVQKNQTVRKGDLIGYVGSTGYSTGPHLHFEIRENGQPIDPMPYLQ